MFFNHKNTDEDRSQNHFFYYGGNYPGESTEPFFHSGLTDYCLRVSVATHIGKVRGNHEDNFYLEGLYMNDIFRNDFSATYTIRNADGMSFAVFDGMGGAAYGEVASEIAVQKEIREKTEICRRDTYAGSAGFLVYHRSQRRNL